VCPSPGTETSVFGIRASTISVDSTSAFATYACYYRDFKTCGPGFNDFNQDEDVSDSGYNAVQVFLCLGILFAGLNYLSVQILNRAGKTNFDGDAVFAIYGIGGTRAPVPRVNTFVFGSCYLE